MRIVLSTATTGCHLSEERGARRPLTPASSMFKVTRSWQWGEK